MDEQNVLRILVGARAIITNSHVVLRSRKHSSVYVDKRRVWVHPKLASLLCLEIAERFADDHVEVVVAPAMGGIVMAQWIAYHLRRITGKQILAVHAEKETRSIPDPERKGRSCSYETGKFLIPGEHVEDVARRRALVADDIATTGGSLREVVEAVRRTGGNVVGVGILCNRGKITSASAGDVPKFIALANVEADVWDEKDCPLCLQRRPINESVGHGAEFVARER